MEFEDEDDDTETLIEKHYWESVSLVDENKRAVMGMMDSIHKILDQIKYIRVETVQNEKIDQFKAITSYADSLLKPLGRMCEAISICSTAHRGQIGN
jgi:hypothetical protein